MLGEIKLKDNVQLSFDLSGDNMVVQSNLLIYANYDLSALEQKILLILISTIKKNDNSLNILEFLVKDLANILGVSCELLYRDLPKLCKNIMSKVVEIKQPNGSWEMFNIISYANYKSKEGRIILGINKKAEPYLLQLKELFTSFKLNNAINLSGKYAIRIYQLTKGCLFKGKLTYDIDDFRKVLKIDKKKTYNAFSKINEKILTPSIEEINEKSDIEVTFTTKRVGRKIQYINFIIKEKEVKQIKSIKSKNRYKQKTLSFNQFEQRQYSDEYLNRIGNKLSGLD